MCEIFLQLSAEYEARGVRCEADIAHVHGSFSHVMCSHTAPCINPQSEYIIFVPTKEKFCTTENANAAHEQKEAEPGRYTVRMFAQALVSEISGISAENEPFGKSPRSKAARTGNDSL